MRKIFIYVFATVLMMACANKKKPSELQALTDQAEKIEKSLDDAPKESSASKKVFKIKSGFVKFDTDAMGMKMTRDFWFDDYGAQQYEENYMDMMGEKSGGASLVLDGYKYSWNYGATEGVKMKYYQAAATDYENVSQDDIDRYGMKKLGNETIAGRKCLKVSIEKPVVSTVWVWEGIGLKTISKFGGKDVLMEATEVQEGGVETSRFEVPKEITFVEQ